MSEGTPVHPRSSGGTTNTLGNMPSNYITKIGAGLFTFGEKLLGKEGYIDMGTHKQVILSCCRDMVVCCVAFWVRLS
jgi:hypothetical protein